MSPPRKVGGGGFRGPSLVQNVAVNPTCEEVDKKTQPCFESYVGGAWLDVDLLQWRSDKFLVRYTLSGGSDSWVSLSHLRLRARESDEWDCSILNRGVDVSVFGRHPETEPEKESLYDAKIIFVKKLKHQADCTCKFYTQYFSIGDDKPPKHPKRLLLTDTLVEELHISSLRLLQQPGIIPLHEIIRANISGKWKPKPERWFMDAYFLGETELSIFRDPKGEESTTTPGFDTPPDVSDEDLADPVARPGPMYVDHPDGSKAPKVPVQKTTLGDSENAAAHRLHRKEKAEADHRVKKNSGLGTKFPDRGVKRKQDSVDEKEVSNVVQEGQSPGESSRFNKPKEKIGDGERRQDQNLGQNRTSKEDTRHDSEGMGGKPKRGRRLKLADSESTPEEILSNTSQERIVDSDHSRERGNNRDGFPRQRIHEESYLPRKNPVHMSAEQVFKSRSIGRPQKSFDKIAERVEVEVTDRGRPSIRKVEKRSIPGENPKLGRLDEDQGERKRGRPRGSPKDCPGRSKHSVEPERKNSESPIANLDTNNVTVAGIDTGCDRRGSKVKQGPDLKQPERLATKRSSDKQKVNPLKQTLSKELHKKEREKTDIDPGLGKSDEDFSTPSSNSEEPASETSNQLGKLRRRNSGRPKKLFTRSQSKSNKVPSTRIQKDADKENPYPEKATRRPLYMDLLGNNGSDEDDAGKAEMPCPVKEQNPNFGLNNDWDPILKDELSDSDCNILAEEGPKVPKWQDFDVAETPAAGIEQNIFPQAGEDDIQAEVAKDDIHPEVSKSNPDDINCKHDYVLKDDVGMICGYCGVIDTPIEEIAPEVDFTQRRSREVDLDEWDLDRSSPDIKRPALGFDQVNNVEEVTMLNTCLPPHYARQMHPHQKDGFEFLWRNLGHAQGKVRSGDKNAGCILSHAPGTGKSFLIIAFLKSYMDKFPRCRPLIVAPKIMLLRWEKEFARWKSDIKVFILNTAAAIGKRLIQRHDESNAISLRGHQMNGRNTVDTCRTATLYEWARRRSVCLVSYSLFSSLTDEEVSRRSPEGELVRSTLLDYPGILILDEGHFPRNSHTKIRKALMKVRTNARILLSGTLFQNNFVELFNTLYLVRPGFVTAFSKCIPRSMSELVVNDTSGEHANDNLAMEQVTEAAENKARKLFVEDIGAKIEEGQASKGSEVFRNGLQSLQKLTEDFVHPHTGEVLASLPGLRDFGILLKPTTLQCTLLTLLEQRFQKSDEYLKREIGVSTASIHPNLLNKMEFVKGDIFDSLMDLRDQCDLSAMSKEPTDPQDGVKTKFVFDLLRSLNKFMTEKVLIFSQHILPLELLEGMFKAGFNWDRNKDVLRLDGSTPLTDREIVIERFNDPHSSVKVLLASTKACGEGINLVGASRVVFLDVLWNPAVIQQAISRAFRLGQKKTVFVYRLIASGTIEEKKYKKAIRKDWLSKAIFCPVAGQASASLDQPEESHCSPNLSPAEELLAWEVDATTCEDDLLEKLLHQDQSEEKSFLKVIEHGSQFHNRKTSHGADARAWFLDGEESREEDKANPEELASQLLQDYGELTYDVGAASSSDTDDECL